MSKPNSKWDIPCCASIIILYKFISRNRKNLLIPACHTTCIVCTLWSDAHVLIVFIYQLSQFKLKMYTNCVLPNCHKLIMHLEIKYLQTSQLITQLLTSLPHKAWTISCKLLHVECHIKSKFSTLRCYFESKIMLYKFDNAIRLR